MSAYAPALQLVQAGAADDDEKVPIAQPGHAAAYEREYLLAAQATHALWPVVAA